MNTKDQQKSRELVLMAASMPCKECPCFGSCPAPLVPCNEVLQGWTEGTYTPPPPPPREPGVWQKFREAAHFEIKLLLDIFK